MRDGGAPARCVFGGQTAKRDRRRFRGFAVVRIEKTAERLLALNRESLIWQPAGLVSGAPVAWRSGIRLSGP